MKKVSKLTALLAAGLLALGTFSFVSCSNGSGESSDTNNPTVTKEVTTTTTTITIEGTNYTYTTVDGTSQNSDGVTISDDGTITITADDGSKLTIKGTSITYTNSEGKIYSGTSSDSSDSESITLTGDSGETITATSESETKTETVSSDSAGSGTVRELTFTDLEGKIFNYKKDNGDDRWYKFEGGKVYKSSDKTYWDDETSDWEDYGKSVALLNGTQYSVVEGKLPRTSGSGLYATFTEGTISAKLKNDGTYTLIDSGASGATMSGTFTNNNGLLTMTMEDEAMYGFYDGSSIYMVDDLLTEEVVRELSFTDLEGKIFNYKDDDDGEDRWYKFEDGKVYKATSLEYQNWSDDTSDWEENGSSVALLNGSQYSVVEGKLPRTSGSGLYATFTEGTISAKLKNDGTYTLIDSGASGATMSGTFTNNNGLLAMARAGKTTLYGFYDGSSIYIVSKLLTKVTN